jgi:hypothetical protein
MLSHLPAFFRSHGARAIGLIFAAQGILFGSWAALIPFVKHKFDLDEAQLGLLLLSLQGGVLVMNPLSVPLLHRLGAPGAARWALAAAAVFFAFPLPAPAVWAVALALFAAGAGFAAANIAMNTCATLFENRENLRIMSTCHGLWSAGAMAGSAMSGTATGLGMAPWLWMGLVGASVLLVAWQLRGQLTFLDERGHQPETVGQGQRFAWPSRLLWLIISVSLCTNVTEGTMADWAAVFMRDVVRSDAYTLGWGFAAYAFFMAAGRFLGDGLLARFKQSAVLSVGGLVASAGLFLLAAFPSMPFVLLWFSMIGAGVSLGAPILYAAAARAPGMARGAWFGYDEHFCHCSVFFGGPVLIGFLAKIWSLPFAFAVVGAAALWWAWGGSRLREA